MNKIEKFTEEEIPFEILANFGVTQEMMDDLPTSVRNQFLSGRTTPVIPIATENVDGATGGMIWMICLLDCG